MNKRSNCERADHFSGEVLSDFGIEAMLPHRQTAVDDLHAALRGLRERPGWLARCMQALSINLPIATMQQKLRQLARRLSASSGKSA